MPSIPPKTINTGLDLTKFACAILIVFLHSFLHDLGAGGEWFRNVIVIISVPFFFITSGYFFTKGLMRNDYSVEYLKKYAWRIGKMYVAWSVITLPVSWLCIEWGHPDYSIPLKIVYLFRMFLFSGSCGIYWYLLAVFECSFIIYFFTKKKKEGWMYIISTIFFIIGTLYSSSYNNGNLLFKFIHIVFGSENNFINMGLFYMCIGSFFATHTIKCSQVTMVLFIILSIFIRTMESQHTGIKFTQSILAGALFLWASNTHFAISDQLSVSLRKLSTAIYLLHFPFLLVFDYNFKRDTLTGFFSALVFSIVIYYLLRSILSKKKLALFFG